MCKGNRQHGHAKKRRESPTYRSWHSMKSRCLSPSQIKRRPSYGLIQICDEWLDSFEAFLRDMGERPEGTSIDRINNSKGYYKENCRWATAEQQQNNTKTTVIIEFNGERLGVNQWARKMGIPQTTLQRRIRDGWPAEIALTAPSHKGKTPDGLKRK